MSAGDSTVPDTDTKGKVEGEVMDQSNETPASNKVKAEATASTSQIAAEMMQNPQVLAALQNRIEDMVGQSSGYIESLPAAVKRRVNALKNLQVKSMKIESKFFEEVHRLERKYMELYGPLFDRRRDIINSVIEPTDSECEWQSDEEDDDEEEKKENGAESNEKDLSEKANMKKPEEEEEKGIPEFWLTIFKSTDILQDMIQEHDEPILKCLTDIRVTFSESVDPMTFTLEFYFEPNEYFSNTVLTKCYRMRHQLDEKEPFSFDAPEIIHCSGCDIDWQKEKNVTVKTVKKKQKHKGRGTVRTVSKQVANDSFFNFFKPPEIPEDETELDSDTEQLLTSDFEIGHLIRERIVPRAILYFTGEAQMQYDYDEEEEEEEEEEGHEQSLGESGDSENDSDYDPSKDRAAKEGAPECKQQ